MTVTVQFDGLVTVDRNTIGANGNRLFAGLWQRGKARKAAVCSLSGIEIRKGDRIYRPITNGMERMHRVHAAYMEARAAADRKIGAGNG